jgi:glycosyltransferase involved in cell wall biosynthesis
MKSNPVISIAIPTYNRLENLLETLGWLEQQDGFYDNDVEIVISDNHSPINLLPEIKNFQEKYGKKIIFNRNDRNEGIDGNIHRVSELANGDYILFMSDDDVLLPGTLRYLKNILQSHPDLLFCFVNGYPFSGKYEPGNIKSSIIEINKTLITHSADDLIKTIWIWSTFLSSFFVDRRAWIGVENRKKYIGTDIYLTHVLYRLLVKYPEKVKMVISEPRLAARMEFTGSYRIIFAFGLHFMKLICVDAPLLGFSKHILRKIKIRSICHGLPPMVMMIRCGQHPRYLSFSEVRMLFKYLWWEPLAWIYLLPPTLLPKSFLIKLRILVRFLRSYKK